MITGKLTVQMLKMRVRVAIRNVKEEDANPKEELHVGKDVAENTYDHAKVFVMEPLAI